MFDTYQYKDINEAAEDLAGNWKQFDSFAWFNDDIDENDKENWTILYTRNRDSDLLTESNHEQIEEMLQPFIDSDDCIPEIHNHWACGWIEGFTIRIFNPDGTIAQCFEKVWEIAESLSNYPVLNDEDHSEKEYNATLENIGEALRDVTNQYDLEDFTDDTIGDLFSWFWDNNQSAVESRDGFGGYPTEEQIIEGLKGLNLWKEYYTEPIDLETIRVFDRSETIIFDITQETLSDIFGYWFDTQSTAHIDTLENWLNEDNGSGAEYLLDNKLCRVEYCVGITS